MNDDLPEDFDPEAYLAINTDVAKAGMEPAEHYLRFGRREGRVYRRNAPLGERPPEGFDPDVYLEINPDVAQSGQDPTLHYIKHGSREGRTYFRSTPIFTQSPIADPADTNASQSKTSPIYPIDPKVIAFYLPQYHRVAENDLWWGDGFTEWTNVKTAEPNIVGHSQPKVPLGRNYYDLLDIEAHARQAMLAETYGIDAFCYYMYWFNGRRILEKPLDMRLNEKSIDHKFCICWANENWTRTWDGRESDVLLRQVHSQASDRQFIKDAMKYLSDRRYLRVDGRLLFLVYRADLIPNCVDSAEIWREEVRRAGLGELQLCAVQSFDIGDPRPFGFDAAVEFPPHGWFIDRNLPSTPRRIVNSRFRGHVFDYARAVDFALGRSYPEYRWYRGVFPSWDNTPRRQDASHFFIDESAPEFRRWLEGVFRLQAANNEPEHQITFINAWNEWGEGAYLEPDEATGLERLEAVRSALAEVSRKR